MSSVKSCGKSSALKTVKGFTVLELIIVIAIIAILAGISSIAVQGFVRDARLEAANNKAQQVYSAVQNALIQFEITQDYTVIDADVLDGTSLTETAKYIELQFEMNNGTMSGSDVTVKSVTKSKNFTYGSAYSFPSATPYSDDTGKRFSKLAKYLCDSLSEEFTGYAYVCIDMENYVVDSVLFTEDARVKNSTNGVLDFANTYSKAGSKDGKSVVGCDSVLDQKKKYNGKDSSYLDAKGVVIGYYPMMNDLESGTFTKN